MAVDPQVVKDALSNLNQVAEAQVALAASGQVATTSLLQNIQAFQFLRSEIDRTTQAAKKQQEQAKSLAKSFEEFNRPLLSMTVGLAASSAALLKFTHSANPQLVGAFNTQLELLQAKIGNTLLPLFSELMDGVDDVIEWFDGLSEGQKKLVAGLAVGLPLVIGFGRALYTLAPAFAVAQASLEKLRASASTSPYLGAAAGALGPAAIATATVGALRGIQGPQGRPLFGRDAPGEKEGKTTQDEMNFATQVLNTIHHGMQAGSLEEMRAQAKDRAQKLRDVERRDERNFFSVNGGWTRLPEGDAGKAAEILERFSESGFEGGKDEIAWRKKVSRLNRQVVTAGRESQPHFSNVADVTKQMTLQQLGKNPYEQQLLQEQRKTVKILQKMLEEEMKKGAAKGYHVSAQ